MMNGQDAGPLAGWAVVQAHGLTLIGRRTGTGDRLAPVYELKPQMGMSNQGMQLAHVVIPIWLLGIDSFDIPTGAIVEPCESFTREQRKRLHEACVAAGELQASFKQEGARVMLAGPGTKLPPPPGE